MTRKELLKAAGVALILYFEGSTPLRAMLDWLRRPFPEAPLETVHAEFAAIRDAFKALPPGESAFHLSEEIDQDPLSHQRFISVGFPRRCEHHARYGFTYSREGYHVAARP